MKKVTQEELDAVKQDFKHDMDGILTIMNSLRTDLKESNKQISDLQPHYEELRNKDEIILNQSKEIDGLLTERITLKTRLNKLIKENEELKEEQE